MLHLKCNGRSPCRSIGSPISRLRPTRMRRTPTPHPAPVPVSACRMAPPPPPTLTPAPAFRLLDERLWCVVSSFSPRRLMDSPITAPTLRRPLSHSNEDAWDPFCDDCRGPHDKDVDNSRQRRRPPRACGRLEGVMPHPAPVPLSACRTTPPPPTLTPAPAPA